MRRRVENLHVCQKGRRRRDVPVEIVDQFGVRAQRRRRLRRLVRRQGQGASFREHYDLGWMLRRDWATLGPKVRGKLHIYVGEADNYFLNNAVYLVEEILKSATNPTAEAEVDYESRAEHCWNGDHTRPNAYSRLRYAQMFIPRMMAQIRKNHPADVDTMSWRY